MTGVYADGEEIDGLDILTEWYGSDMGSMIKTFEKVTITLTKNGGFIMNNPAVSSEELKATYVFRDSFIEVHDINDNSDTAVFDYKDGKLYVDNILNGVSFVLSKR